MKIIYPNGRGRLPHLTVSGEVREPVHGGGSPHRCDPLIQQLIPYLIARARSSPDLAAAVRQLPGPSREAGRVVLRAIDRGELVPGADIELALDLIAGPVSMLAKHPQKG